MPAPIIQLPAFSPGESCGDFGIRIDRNGQWYHQGSPIGRLALVRLFASVLRREADGSYWLVTPVERGRIEVEDAPFLAVELVASGSGPAQSLRFRTNIDDWVTAGVDHPIRVETDPDTAEPRPYLHVRDGLDARINRAVFFQLADLGVEGPAEEGGFGVWSEGRFFSLGSLDGTPG